MNKIKFCYKINMITNNRIKKAHKFVGRIEFKCKINSYKNKLMKR